ncbi:MAG TPA: hypothetical protein VD969_06055 [Symbiobacteriaceae bacterium]|nr:hypothetical protein [Symbiobacteriaceae bacterium]
MSRPICGPGDRYSVELEILAAQGAKPFARHEAAGGEPLPGSAWLVVAGDACSLTLVPGENGLTLQSVKLLRASRAVVTARVRARGGAPDWLPTDSSYLLFQGGRDDAAAVRDRYIPLEGMAAERSWAPEPGVTPLDRLAVAVGRSVARANAVLARTQAESGVALVSRVTIRVGVKQTDLGQGRVLVTLAGPGEGDCQYVELTMTTVPGAPPTGDGAAAPDQGGRTPAPPGGTSPGAGSAAPR